MFGLNIPISWFAMAGMGVALVVTSTGWSNTSDKLKAERAAHEQTKIDHKAEIDRFKQAQQEADRKAKETAERLRKEAEANAKQADARYDDLYAQYRANLLRYRANQGNSGGPNRGELPAAGSGNGPSGSPNVSPGELIISMRDAEVCAVNTARLQSVREWALTYAKEAQRY